MNPDSKDCVEYFKLERTFSGIAINAFVLGVEIRVDTTLGSNDMYLSVSPKIYNDIKDYSLKHTNRPLK